jgi:hypothetical protein
MLKERLVQLRESERDLLGYLVNTEDKSSKRDLRGMLRIIRDEISEINRELNIDNRS